MGTRNDPGVLPGRTIGVFGIEGADAGSRCPAPARDTRDGDAAAADRTSLAAALSNHEAVVGEADVRRAARGNASLRVALTAGLCSRNAFPRITSITTRGHF